MLHLLQLKSQITFKVRLFEVDYKTQSIVSSVRLNISVYNWDNRFDIKRLSTEILTRAVATMGADIVESSFIIELFDFKVGKFSIFNRFTNCAD